jgi:hypothetical protein
MLLTEGQTSDYKGAALMLDAMPKAKAMLGDRGHRDGSVHLNNPARLLSGAAAGFMPLRETVG